MKAFAGRWRVLALAAALIGWVGIVAGQTGVAKAAYDRGDAARKSRNYDEAIKGYDEAIRLDPNCADCYFMRAMVHRSNKKDYDKALADINECIRLDGDKHNAISYGLRADIYIDKGNYAKAITDYETALRFAPDDAFFISNMKEGLKEARERAGGAAQQPQAQYQPPPPPPAPKPQTGLDASGTLTDGRDGKQYKTVVIGGNRWMAENLNHYEPKNGNAWSTCYNDDNSNCAKWGRLYTWNMAKTVCPQGWHLPSRQEWEALRCAVGGGGAGEYVSASGMTRWAVGNRLKSRSGWRGRDVGTDDYGFSALPGGTRYDNGFANSGGYGHWWTATEYDAEKAYGLQISEDVDFMFEYETYKRFARSVRCISNDAKVSSGGCTGSSVSANSGGGGYSGGGYNAAPAAPVPRGCDGSYITCPACFGTGKHGTCTLCGGTGIRRDLRGNPRCMVCSGTGIGICGVCSGVGRVSTSDPRFCNENIYYGRYLNSGDLFNPSGSTGGGGGDGGGGGGSSSDCASYRRQYDHYKNAAADASSSQASYIRMDKSSEVDPRQERLKRQSGSSLREYTNEMSNISRQARQAGCPGF